MVGSIPDTKRGTDKYLVVLLQLLVTSYPCYKNNCITKFCAPALTFSIYWFTLTLYLAESARELFRVLIYAVGAQVYQIISLYYKSTLTTMINSNFSRLGSYWIFSFFTSIHGVTRSPFSC